MIWCGCKRLAFSLCFVAILLFATYAAFPIMFETNDDSGILYSIAGYRTGAPESTTIFTNVMYGFFISRFYILMPTIDWYTTAHILFIFISCTMILKSMLKMAARGKGFPWVPILLYLALHATAFLYYSVFLQFTTTPAMLGSAACTVAVTLFSGESRRERIFDIIVIVFLLFFSYIMRPSSGQAMLIYFGFVLIMKLLFLRCQAATFKHYGTFIVVALSVVGCITLAKTAQVVSESQNGMKEFRTYHRERADFKDYDHMTFTEAPEVYQEIGWDLQIYALTDDWFFLDRRITQENFATINAYTQDKLMPNIESVKETFFTLFKQHIIAHLGLACLLVTFLLSFLLGMKHKNYIQVLYAVLLLGGFLSACLYLCYQGRFPLRVYFLVLLPALTLIMLQLATQLQVKNRIEPGQRRQGIVAILATLAVVMVCSCYFAVSQQVHTVDKEGIRKRMEAEQYAIQHPNDIYIYDNSMAYSTRPFAVYSDVKPVNYIFWGGSTMYSPLYYGQLAANGLNELYADSFLKPNYYYVSLGHANPTLTEYMQTQYDANCIWIDEFDGVNIYQFASA